MTRRYIIRIGELGPMEILAKHPRAVVNRCVTEPDTVAIVREPMSDTEELVDHPAHYGGKDDPYEAIKVIEAWGLDFHLGNAVKYIARAGKKNPDTEIEDLRKAVWYINRFIEMKEGKE